MKIHLVLAGLLAAGGSGLAAQTGPAAAMYHSSTLMENLLNAPQYASLVTAVEGAGLVDALEDAGPYTLFAPENAAFTGLGDGGMNALLAPGAHAQLIALVKYHLVKGDLNAKRLRKLIKAGHGRAELTTVQGEKLLVSLDDGRLTTTDAQGGRASGAFKPVKQWNGELYGIDHVLEPGTQPVPGSSGGASTTGSTQ